MHVAVYTFGLQNLCNNFGL